MFTSSMMADVLSAHDRCTSLVLFKRVPGFCTAGARQGARFARRSKTRIVSRLFFDKSIL